MGLYKGKSVFDPTQFSDSDLIGSYLVDSAGNLLTSQASGSARALDVGISVAGVQVDPRAIRALLATDIVTAHITDSAGASITVGQKTSATSVPVVIASDQSSIKTTAANGTFVDHSGSTSATANTATTLMAANANRKYLIIQNNSLNVIWINFTTTATTSQPSVQLTAGSIFTMEGSFVSTEAISVISNKPSSAFTAKEG